MNKQEYIFVAGNRGMVGSAIIRLLKKRKYQNILAPSRAELDLTDQHAVQNFFSNNRIDRVILAAAKVGGIYANSAYPAEFIYSNLSIQSNVIHQAWKAGVNNLLFLGSSCIYPKFCPQPIQETHLLTGKLEPTNAPYAVAKIAGLIMCESYNRQYGTCYFSVMPTNLYGPGDNYQLENCHVIPAMIRKFHLAKLAYEGDLKGIQRDQALYGPIPEDTCRAIGYVAGTGVLDRTLTPKVILWGTGAPRREFLHVDDMAQACLHMMHVDPFYFSNDHLSYINIGYGSDITIKEVADLISNVVGFRGDVIYDDTKPDGASHKLLDSSKSALLGWKPSINLKSGLTNTYESYKMGGTKPQNEYG